MYNNQLFTASCLAEILQQLMIYRPNGMLTIRLVIADHFEEAILKIENGRPVYILHGTQEDRITEQILTWLNSWGEVSFYFQPLTNMLSGPNSYASPSPDSGRLDRQVPPVSNPYSSGSLSPDSGRLNSNMLPESHPYSSLSTSPNSDNLDRRMLNDSNPYLTQPPSSDSGRFNQNLSPNTSPYPSRLPSSDSGRISGNPLRTSANPPAKPVIPKPPTPSNPPTSPKPSGSSNSPSGVRKNRSPQQFNSSEQTHTYTRRQTAPEAIIPLLTTTGRDFPVAQLPRMDRAVFLLINGKRSLVEISQITRRPQENVLATLQQLRDQQLLVFDE